MVSSLCRVRDVGDVGDVGDERGDDGEARPRQKTSTPENEIWLIK